MKMRNKTDTNHEIMCISNSNIILKAKPSQVIVTSIHSTMIGIWEYSLYAIHIHVTILAADMQNEKKNEAKKRIAKEGKKTIIKKKL